MASCAETFQPNKFFFPAGQAENSLPKKEHPSPERQMIEALGSERAVNFVKSVLLDSYRSFFPNHADEASGLVQKAFHLLGLLEEAPLDNGAVKNAFITIHKSVFKPDEPNFWFNREYAEYREYRSEKDFEQIKPYIKGTKLLDFGCGAAYLAETLAGGGFSVHAADVEDWRRSKSPKIGFKKMSSPIDIDYPDNHFDTIFAYHVFHHIDPEDLPTVINRLAKAGKRLVVKEDIYGVSTDDPEFKRLAPEQSYLSAFANLSLGEQILCNRLWDYIANMIGQGRFSMNMPFQYKTIKEWEKGFAAGGFQIVQSVLTGFETHKLHKNCQAIIIADSRENKDKKG